jgi:hypothetical protein
MWCQSLQPKNETQLVFAADANGSVTLSTEHGGNEMTTTLSELKRAAKIILAYEAPSSDPPEK